MENNLRMCVACRQLHERKKLIRLVRYDGKFSFDDTKDGRGAYVCKNYDCINKCIKKRLFDKSYKSRVDDNIYSTLDNYKKLI